MKYFTKKAIIETIEVEKSVSVQKLHSARLDYIADSLSDSLVGSELSVQLINSLHNTVCLLDRQAVELANFYKAGNLSDSMSRYETVLAKLNPYYNPTNPKATAYAVIKAYVIGSRYLSEEDVLKIINPKAHFDSIAMQDRIDEVRNQYNTLIRNLRALSSAKQCVKYLESIGYDPTLFTYEGTEPCTALVIPLNTDLLIGMKKPETTETPEEGI